MRRLVLPLAAALCMAAAPPDGSDEAEIEARTAAVSQKLRCVVCKNQSIAESDAPLAKDLQRLVRERIEAGDSDEAAIDHIVARYGEFVLLEPRKSMRNIGLWAGPFAVLLLGGGAAAIFIRSRGSAPAEAPALTPAEEAELARLRGGGDREKG